MTVTNDKVVNHNTSFAESKDKFKQAYELAGEAASDIVQEVKGKAGEKYTAGRQQGEELSGKAEKLIKDNPLATVGCAFAAGWLISKLTK